MKKLGYALLVSIITCNVFAQCLQQCDFDDSPEHNCDQIFIDTINNPNNIWEIGKSNKSASNIIATILDSFYPVNDTSSFIFNYIIPDRRDFGEIEYLRGYYWIDSDSTDFGDIEFYHSRLSKWISLVYDSLYVRRWPEGFVFSGKSDGWERFSTELGLGNEEAPGDTVQLRFTFISDSIPDEKEGWMLDGIELIGWCESSIDGLNAEANVLSIYPNPLTTTSQILISDETFFNGLVDYTVYNMQGQIVLQEFNVTIEDIVLYRKHLDGGLYLLQVKDCSGNWAKVKLLVE